MLRIGIAVLAYPTHYKRDPATGEAVYGDTDATGDLYMDPSVPFEGSIISYATELIDVP